MPEEEFEIERKWTEFKGSPPPINGNRMYLSINNKGIIVLNRKSFHELGKPEAVTLLYDGDHYVIGLRPCRRIMPNAFPLAPRGHTGAHVIWAHAFAKQYDIKPSGTIRFVEPKMENGILTLDLNHTARTTQTPRTGWRKSKRK